MYGLINESLRGRDPIRVAVIGAGWQGGGVIGELLRLAGTAPTVVVEREPERAVARLRAGGVDAADIRVAHTSAELSGAERYRVLADLRLLEQIDDVDIVYEATGEVAVGADVALLAMERRLPLVTANFETDATVGLRLAEIARERGVLYSLCDGDQPTVIARMVEEVCAWGFEPRVVGNCKGFLDVHQDPEGVLPYVGPGLSAYKACAMADGTKQSIEMAVLANGLGYRPAVRGMLGPRTTKSGLVRTFAQRIDLDGLDTAIVDYVTGIDGADRGAGVFVVARGDRARREDLAFLKKGDGPFYLFFRDHHLCYIEAYASIVEAVVFERATLAPRRWNTEVIAVAKRDLEPGRPLDGIGGFDCYGVIEDAREAVGLLPIGLTELATVTRPVARDAAVTLGDVELRDSPLLRLRRDQDARAGLR